jgi:hypothetical protein
MIRRSMIERFRQSNDELRGARRMDVDEEYLALIDTNELVVCWGRGESIALGEIWRRHHAWMRGLAGRYLQPYDELSRLYEADDFLYEVVGRLTMQALRGDLSERTVGVNDFWMLFRDPLRQCIREARERNSAIKRGGDRAERGSRAGYPAARGPRPRSPTTSTCSSPARSAPRRSR